MRDFFISSLEKIVTVIIVIMIVGVIVAGLGTMFNADGGFLAGIGILIVGAIYVLMMGGMLYLALGVYDNTKRTAEAVERLADK